MRNNYTIGNSLAERCICPLANERKNSLFFGSDKMARVSAAYHSIVSTCKLQGYSILEYLKKFFSEIVAGNRDYGKLMPSTIGISENNLQNQPSFNLILDVPPVKQGIRQNWTLTSQTGDTSVLNAYK